MAFMMPGAAALLEEAVPAAPGAPGRPPPPGGSAHGDVVAPPAGAASCAAGRAPETPRAAPVEGAPPGAPPPDGGASVAGAAPLAAELAPFPAGDPAGPGSAARSPTAVPAALSCGDAGGGVAAPHSAPLVSPLAPCGAGSGGKPPAAEALGDATGLTRTAAPPATPPRGPGVPGGGPGVPGGGGVGDADGGMSPFVLLAPPPPQDPECPDATLLALWRVFTRYCPPTTTEASIVMAPAALRALCHDCRFAGVGPDVADAIHATAAAGRASRRVGFSVFRGAVLQGLRAAVRRCPRGRRGMRLHASPLSPRRRVLRRSSSGFASTPRAACTAPAACSGRRTCWCCELNR